MPARRPAWGLRWFVMWQKATGPEAGRIMLDKEPGGARRERMSRSQHAESLVEQLALRLTLRGKSLIITVFGDAIMPHGGSAWLGSLIRLVRPLGLSERMVRTAVFRLAKDDWLEALPIGRRSYYSMTESGRHRFEAAHRRIYQARRTAWDGVWHLVVVPADLPALRRDELKRELGWLGFGQVAPSVLAHPAPDAEALRQTLIDLRLGDKVIVMNASADPASPSAPLRKLTAQCWDLERLEADYAGFLDTFRPVWRALEGAGALDPELCFAVRVMLIHDYRRVLLRDPLLPDELMPAAWPGLAARALCRNLYRLTLEPAERHIMAVLETPEGPAPEAAPFFFGRFAGAAGEPAVEERAQA